MKANLYGAYYLNFTSYISRDGLEQLAQAALATHSHLKIAQVRSELSFVCFLISLPFKIYDQYLNYVSLEDNLFSLEIPRTFKCISAPDSAVVDQISSGLFSVCMSFASAAPVICTLTKSAQDSASLCQQVSARLEGRIRSHLINTKSSLAMTPTAAKSVTASRPLMIIVDRLIDLAGPIKHSSAYNALIDDILGLQGNKITLPPPVNKSFDIDRRDWLWRENATRPFPNVAEAVETALKTYKSDHDRVMQTTPGLTEEMMKGTGGENSALTPEQLKVAINVLPELTERKRLIDTHLQISTALLDAIKSRDLGNLFHLEQSLATLTPGALMNALRDPKVGNARDKVRLLIVYLMGRSQALSANQIEEAVKLCKSAGASEVDLAALEFIQTHISVRKSELQALTPTLPNNAVQSTSAANEASIGDFLTRLSAGGGAVLGSLMSSVKHLLPAQSETPLTKLIDTAYASATGQMITSLSPLGSPLSPSSGTASPLNAPSSLVSLIDPRPKSAASGGPVAYSIDHVILVVLGGAAYSEYDELLEHFAKSRQLQSIKFTLGVTEVINADRLFKLLTE